MPNPVFQIKAGAPANDGQGGARVRLWIRTSRGNELEFERHIPSPSPPTQITKAQVFAACKVLANTLEANEAAAIAAAQTPPPVFTDPTVFDATKAGATAALDADIAPSTGNAPAAGATV